MRTQIPESEEQVVAECKRAMSLAPVDWPSTLPPSQYSWGAPEWYSFEHEAWPIGEGIRQAFVKQPKLRKSSIFGKVAEVICCRNLRRGRQSFIMALAYVAAREYAPILEPLLSDTDVDGQALDTLLKMKARGYAESVRPLLNSDKTWIRNLAKRYIERYQA